MHDLQNPGVTVAVGESTTIMSKFEYADDAALVDADAATATARQTALAAGSLTDAAMVISQAKSNVMHIHHKTHVSSTTESRLANQRLGCTAVGEEGSDMTAAAGLTFCLQCVLRNRWLTVLAGNDVFL